MRKTSWQFGNAIVAWQKIHGRHDLPWQNTQDPYAVWLSEIMLQQTQVVTVRDYFARFMKRFPTVNDLAKASQEEVMGLWSGIGRSTAAAVASLCFGEPIAILDANVKRVLTRYLGFGQDLAVAKNEKLLWEKAQTLLPTQHVAQAMPHYTQGMMDLGATLCTPKNPQCLQCPVKENCKAAKEGKPENYPVKTKKLKRTSEQLWLLYAQSKNGEVWMVQRPQSGIWAGLYCLPVFESYEALQAFVKTKSKLELQDMPVVKHVLTHKDLYLHPVALRLSGQKSLGQGHWVDQQSIAAIGLPAPIRKLVG